MLSARLVRMIESHAEELTRDLIQNLKAHARTPAFRRLSDLELHHRTYNVYKNLGAWLEGKPKEETQRHYEELGERRFAEGIPLQEVIYALILSKKNVLIYARTRGFEGSAVEIFGEQELVNRIDQFYDEAIYYTAVGYQKAMTESRAPVKAAARWP